MDEPEQRERRKSTSTTHSSYEGGSDNSTHRDVLENLRQKALSGTDKPSDRDYHWKKERSFLIFEAIYAAIIRMIGK